MMKKIKIITITTILSIIISGLAYATQAYTFKDLANMKAEDLFNVSISDIKNASSGGVYAPGGYEKNVLCVEHYVKSRVYQDHWLKITKIIDINFDGINTVRVNGTKKNITDKETLKYFNALAYATAHSNETGFKPPWKDAVAALSNASKLDPYIELDGLNGENAFADKERGGAKKTEALNAGETAANYTESTVEASDETDPTCTVIGDNAYLGPFEYSTSKSGEKLNFNSIEVTCEGGSISSTTADPSKDLYKKTSSGFTNVANGSIGQNKSFYIQVDKKVNSATNINVKINIDGPEYYKSRLMYYQNYEMQTFSIFSIGNGAETKSNKVLNYEIELGKLNLVIKKKGAYAGSTENLAGIGFKVYYTKTKSDGTTENRYFKFNGKDELTGSISVSKQKDVGRTKGTIVYTNNKGKIKLKNLNPDYTYKILEVHDNNKYEKEKWTSTVYDWKLLSAKMKRKGESESTDLTINTDGDRVSSIEATDDEGPQKITVTLTNVRKTGTLHIVKQDKDTGKKMDGVKFKVQNKDTGNWVKATGANGVYTLKLYDANNRSYYKDNYTSNKDEATEFETNLNGEVTINGIDIGQYTMEEVYVKYGTDDDHYGYTKRDTPNKIDKNYVEWSTDGGITKHKLSEESPTLEVKDKEEVAQCTIDYINEKNYGTLNIIKEDLEIKDKKVSEVRFKVKNKETGKYIVGAYEDNEKVYYDKSYTDDATEATQFVTNASGEITIKDVKIGNYILEEVYVENNGGTKNYGYTDVEKPGQINGEYVYWSTDGGQNKHRLDKENIEIEVKNPNKVDEGKSKIYVYNKKQYIKITGYVWEDIDPYSKDNATRQGTNNVFDEGLDTTLDGINVRLKYRSGDKKGQIVKTYDIKNKKWVEVVTTANGGKYEFAEVSREAIENGEYLVEFEYNGFTYTSVASVSNGKENNKITSKAKENNNQRKDLNNAFTEITNNNGDITDRTHGQSKDSKDVNANTTGTLTYTNETGQNDEEKWYYSTYQGTTYNNGTYSGVNITADTDLSGFSLQNEFKEGRWAVDANDDAMVIQYVNLGVVKREQPKLAISSDITSVQVTVNNYWHKYDYKQKEKYLQDTDQTGFNVKTKFGRKNGKYKDEEYPRSYYRAIYPSDVKYNEAGADEDKKLKVYVTYETTIKNQSSSLISTVNELVNYHDARYSVVESENQIGNIPDNYKKIMRPYYIDADGNEHTITWQANSKRGYSYNDGNYIGSYTTGIENAQIPAGQTIKVYLTLQVQDDTVLGLLSESKMLNNVTEIYSYSTYYGNTQDTFYYGTDREDCKVGDIYAGVDQASAPGNAKPGDSKTYENDTDIAPSLQLEAKGVRELEGTVFEDATPEEKQYDEKTNKAGKRLGDGIYNDGENTVAGVQVELIYAEGAVGGTAGEIATVYPPARNTSNEDEIDTAENGTEAIAYTKSDDGSLLTTVNRTGKTAKDGYYIFKGVEPDKYLIKYTYENGTTKIFDTSGNEVKDVSVQNYKSTIITSEAIKNAFEENKDYEDWKDILDTYMRWYKTSEDQGRYSDARDNYTQRELIDDDLEDLTGVKQLALEVSLGQKKLGDITDATVKSQVEAELENLTKTLDATTPKISVGVEKEDLYSASTGDTYTAITKNIDFGISERPRQAAKLDKTVTYLSVIAPSGNPIVSGEVDVSKGIAPEHVTIAGNKLYITIDSEYLYGSRLEIKYKLTLTNTGELDYRNETYYYYGTDTINPVQFSSTTLMDYVDSEILLQEGQGNTWKVTQLATEGLTLTQEEKDILLKQYSTVVTAEALPGITIAPGEQNSTDIIVEKLLSTSDNELSYDNNGEVVTIGKTGGSVMTTTLGSYGPELAYNPEAEPDRELEYDDAKAENVSIIPPTGSTDNTVTYVIIGAASLTILGAGTFFIRRIIKK